MANFELMFIVAFLVGLFVYFQLQKVIAKADFNEQSDNTKYVKFCDIIDGEIANLKNYEPQNAELKDEYLDEVANLSKELVFIQTMHVSNINATVWEAKLYGLLNKMDGIVERYIANSDEILNDLKQRLQSKFANL